MTQKKYQIFVSSTFRDLIEERQDAIRSILDLKHIPAGMELFPAADIEQLDYIKKVIDECDYYLLIIGGRYGSMDAAGVSYTEREYEYAVDTKKIIVAFVHNDPASIPVGKSDIDANVVKALNVFRDKVMAGRLVKSWSSRTELEPLVLKSLVHAFNDFPQSGWIRGNNAASEELLEQTNNALRENARLRALVEELKNEEPIVVEGIAGLGDMFTVRYRHKWRNRQATMVYGDGQTSLTWKDIFVSLAGFLEKSKTDSVINEAIREAVKEAGSTDQVYQIDSTDKVTIKVQLEALGLISSRVSKTSEGKIAEFLSLTSKGKRQFIDYRVVKKSV